MASFSKKTLFFCGASFLLGILAAIIFIHFWPSNKALMPFTKIRIANPAFQLVKPLLGVDIGKKGQFTELNDLTRKYGELVNEFLADNTQGKAGVYFRDLDNAHWTGVNETEKFKPRSLLKVPLLITYLKLAETDPGLLSHQLTYRGEDLNVRENIKPSQSVKPGETFSIEELLRRMIVFSDNNAATLLLDNLSPEIADQIYADLDLEFPEGKTAEDYLSAKQYSLFFRILYNVTYLNPTFSEKALKWLSESEFTDGIVAGLPADITVAHKFGERSDSASDETPEYGLHDCGIIYYPDYPYLLCVMSRGENQQRQKQFLKEVSSATYEEMKKIYGD
jgi:beta-lactamase class A